VHPQRDRQHAPNFPRETYIALRARRESHRVAADILYGREYDEELALRPASPPARRTRRALQAPRYISMGSMILLGIVLLCAIVVGAFAIAEGLIRIPKGQ
jgi:hypothetical protein